MRAAEADLTPAKRLILMSRPYVPASYAFFARLATQPTEPRKRAYDNVIRTLIAGGVWAKTDCLQIYAAADSVTALKNLKNSSFTGSLVAAPAFTADRGYKGNDSSSYVNTGFIPATAGLLSSLNDATFAFWNNDGTSSGFGQGVINGGGITRLNVSTTNPEQPSFQPQVNSNSSTASWTFASAAQGDHAHGTLAVTRTSSTDQAFHSRGVSRATNAANTSVAVPNLAMFLQATNNNGSAILFETNQVSAFWYGKALTDAEHACLDLALTTYMRAVGNWAQNLVGWGDSLTGNAGLWMPKQAPLGPIWRRWINKGVFGETPAAILARMQADTTYTDMIQGMFWGRNVISNSTTAVDSAAILSAYASGVATAQARSGKYFVCSVVNSNIDAGTIQSVGEDLGSTKYNSIMAVNATLASLYPDNYIDVRAALVAPGQSGDANDLADFALDRPPRSKMTDDIHFNSAGSAFVATAINTFLDNKGW